MEEERITQWVSKRNCKKDRRKLFLYKSREV